MDYALAKELKEAGWPQAGDGGKLWEGDIYSAYSPTLSELIAVCGDRFILKKGFEASDTGLDSKEIWSATDRYLLEYGSSPEEAVARLWLSLNKVSQGK